MGYIEPFDIDGRCGYCGQVMESKCEFAVWGPRGQVLARCLVHPECVDNFLQRHPAWRVPGLGDDQ